MAARGGSAELSIEGVGKRYGDVVALDHVSLSVAQGELLTILGPSGSGKTTLLKVVAGFETPDGGTVKVGGTDISALPPAKRDIGMVFQNYALFPHLTVKANVAFPLEMRNVARTEIDSRVAEALKDSEVFKHWRDDVLIPGRFDTVCKDLHQGTPPTRMRRQDIAGSRACLKR